jgi:hypothetical protein
MKLPMAEPPSTRVARRLADAAFNFLIAPCYGDSFMLRPSSSSVPRGPMLSCSESVARNTGQRPGGASLAVCQ